MKNMYNKGTRYNDYIVTFSSIDGYFDEFGAIRTKCPKDAVEGYFEFRGKAVSGICRNTAENFERYKDRMIGTAKVYSVGDQAHMIVDYIVR